ncbi:uncharacterized protein YjbJ (UPF0337 family) [Arthrobacter sp. 1088]|uniref:hypothetical protein n=1 Tax=Arthrobacter sp. 1088 TaxID=2817768 RepID=UPI002858F5F2|nr:hypothetical protein [Arthrobacter sp. 1088]MDR6688275.1 uncharacterized protein YjbJ (UPF0337 family) [Arthrobacter sp. 1088]
MGRIVGVFPDGVGDVSAATHERWHAEGEEERASGKVAQGVESVRSVAAQDLTGGPCDLQAAVNVPFCKTIADGAVY